MCQIAVTGAPTPVGAWLRRDGIVSACSKEHTAILESLGCADILYVSAVDIAHMACLLMVPSKSGRWPPRSARQWRNIAQHLAAGLRLRRQLVARPLAAPVTGEIILPSPSRSEIDDDIADRESARTELRHAAHALDLASSTRRRSQEQARAVWQGWVTGHWSLVDAFDAGGRRLLIVHRNDTCSPDPRGLSAPECLVLGYARRGHSNKWIAHELGLAVSTVSMHLAHARTKLRAVTAPAIRSPAAA